MPGQEDLLLSVGLDLSKLSAQSKKVGQEALKSSKNVNLGLSKVDKNVNKATSSLNKMGKAQASMFDNLGKTMAKVAIWAVLWTALYAVIRRVTQAIGSGVDAMVEMEAAMNRIRVVTTSASGDIERSMRSLEQSVKSILVNIPTQLEATTEALFKLSTASLDSAEAAAALQSVMKLVVITSKDLRNQTALAGETAEVVAGIYNNYKEQLGDSLSVSEKFEKITALLADTFADQQVELSELASGLKFTVGVFSQAGISLEVLVATLGVLNTGFVKASKAGTGLQTALVNMIKNSDKLAERFGLVINPDKTVQFIQVLKAMNEALGSGALTAGELGAEYEIFGKRAGKAAIAAIRGIDQIIEQVEKSGTSIERFGKRLEDRMEGVRAQAILTTGIFKVLSTEIAAAFSAPELLTSALKLLNGALKALTKSFVILGTVLKLKGVAAKDEGILGFFKNLILKKDDAKEVIDIILDMVNKLAGLEGEFNLEVQIAKIKKEMEGLAGVSGGGLKARIDLKKEELFLEHQLKMARLSFLNEEEVLRLRLDQLLSKKVQTEEDTVEIYKTQLAILEEQAIKIKEVADIVKNELDIAIFDFAKGGGLEAFEEMGIRLADTFLKRAIEGLTQEFIFAPIFDKMGIAATLQQKAADIQLLASQNNIRAAQMSLTSGGAGGAGGGLSSFAGGSGGAGNLFSMLGGGGGSAGAGAGGAGGAGAGAGAGVGVGASFAASAGASAALFVASRIISQTKDSGKEYWKDVGRRYSGQEGFMKMFMDPLNILGMHKVTKTEVTERTDQIRVSSKLDVTNKKLDILNRNLVGVRRGVEGYVRKQSFYFRQRPSSGVQFQPEEFAFSSNQRRGYT